MISNITVLFNRLVSVFSTYDIIGDTLDILFLTVLCYFVLKLLRDSRALTLVKGIIVFVVAYLLVNILNMEAASYLFKKVIDYIFIILAVIFAPELRKALERLGNARGWASLRALFTKASNDKNISTFNEQESTCINSVCKAAQLMSEKKVGALIVFEKDTPLGDIISTGTPFDSNVNSSIIDSIFYPGAPMHDGAAVIRNDRLVAAGCILPLTARNNDVAKELGTRHRAAIGMSEQSDAMILVVSEETGGLSIACNGTLQRDLTDGDVRDILLNYLIIKDDKTTFGKGVLKNGK